MGSREVTWASFQGGLAPRTTSGPFAWREAGQGPAVLLIHSVGLNADVWEPQIGALAGRRRVIAADLPGHGQSAPLKTEGGLGEYVTAMAGLIDALGIAPVSVVGHSFGAMIALGLALDHPQKVGSLVTLNAVYCRDAQTRAAVEGRARLVSVRHVDAIETIARWFPNDPNGPLARRVTTWLRSVDPQAYAAAYRVFASADRIHQGRLGDLACRALFITGVADARASPAMSERMAREVPNARALALPGAGHMMNLTHPAETASAIAGFLNAAPRSR